MKPTLKTSIFLFLILCITANAGAQLSKKDLSQIDETVKKAFTTFQTTGLAISVVVNDQIVYHQGLGFGNYKEKKPVNTTSLFNIASCSKAFTAASIGMLVDEGKLKWTDKVVSYFPEFKLSDDYITRELTVEDLLCHRSGLGTFYGDLLWYGTNYSDEEVMRRIRFEPITRRFGIEYGYQNIMFLVAGKLVEKVSGQTWSEFVRNRIFIPLGMNETRPSNDELTPGQDVAEGHLNNEVLERYDFNAAKPAAGIFSSVDELSNWTMMILDKGMYRGKRIISEASLTRILEPHTIMGNSDFNRQHGINFNAYAMGWRVHDYNGEKIAEHNGGMPGYISKVVMVPSKGISMVILNNGNDPYINEALKYDLLEILVKGRDYDWLTEYTGIKVKSDAADKISKEERLKSRVTGTSPSHPAGAYAGVYRDISYGDAEVKLADGNELTFTMLPTGKIFTGDMEHWHYDTYKVVFRDKYLTYALITFSFDSAGKTTGFKIDLPNDDFWFWNLDFKKIK
jgi:CubicO group peptidase (beta-lactamase class C family)